ncbi:MAG: hypothetical protein IKW18_02670 [Clostridia bacterium]|nr:hypothetical protein [Clostridia bacterium]
MIRHDYTFAPPHRITLSRPSASEKLLADINVQGISIAWAFQSLVNDVPLTWTNHPKDVTMYYGAYLDGEELAFTKWYRHESGAPYLFAEAEIDDFKMTVSAIACKTGVIIRTESESFGNLPRKLHVQFSHTNGWVISNQGWIDGKNNHVLLKMNGGRADRILAVGKGADEYLMYGLAGGTGEVPMANVKYGVKPHSMKKITSLFLLNPNQKKIGYYIIPYEKYFAEISSVEAIDPEKEMTEALAEWTNLLDRGARFTLSDGDVWHSWRACLADLFVMREKIGDYTGICCGTDFYRSANSGEPLETEMLLDTLGYAEEALADYPMYLDIEEENGSWISSKGWEHEVWGVAYNKASAVMTHYALTGDRAFLESYYKKMYRSTLFHDRARLSTKQSPVEGERGLLPRGMGDCGMMNGSDYYGVFYSINCQAIAADRLTLEAAEILGKTEDLKVLRPMYERAKEDLLLSIRNHAVEEDGYVRMPSVVTARPTCLYGSLFGFWPAEILEKEDPIIKGTLQYTETCAISEGGLPMGTGWMKDGLWVAMALGSLARTYLRMGFYEKARAYLYPALNHASPLITYCEERGWEKNSERISGDKQHLWTPLSVCQYMVDAVYFSFQGETHLLAGICPEWIENSDIFAVENLKTPFGNMNLSIQKGTDSYNFSVETERPMTGKTVLHIPCADGDKEQVLDVDGKTKLRVCIPF